MEQKGNTRQRLSPQFTGAAINLADLYRQTGRDDNSDKVSREAMRVSLRGLPHRRSPMSNWLKSRSKREQLKFVGTAAAAMCAGLFALYKFYWSSQPAMSLQAKYKICRSANQNECASGETWISCVQGEKPGLFRWVRRGFVT